MFSPFRGSLSLSLSHAETNFKTNVWDQGNSFLNKGNRAASVISRHTNRTYLEKIPDLYLSAPSLALPFACLSAAGIPVK